MGFFDKVKGMLEDFKIEARRKEEDKLPPEDITIKYEDALNWLDSVSKPFLEDVEVHLSGVMKSLTYEKAQLEKDVHGLSSAKIEELRDKRMERAVVNNRKALLSRLNMFCHSVRHPKNIKASEAPGSFDDMKKQMGALMSDTTKNFYFVSSGVPSHSEKVKKDLFEMSKIIEDAIKYLRPLNGKIKSIDDSYKIVRELDDMFLKKREMDEDVVIGDGKLKVLARSKKTLDKKIKEIDAGAGVRRLKDLNENRESIASEINAVRSRIVQAVSPVSRALRKYGRVAQLGGKDEERLLELYIDDPVAAVKEDDGMKLFGKVIADVELHVSGGSITLKDKLKAKTISAISRLKKDNELGDLKEKLLSLDNKEKALRAKIESDKTMQMRVDLEMEHTKLCSEIESEESDVSLKRKNMESMTRDIKSKMKVLEGKLSGTGNYRVKISY